ncbi:MAG: hypothetical protein Q9168_005676 [Polycauliona sp. 1 TL-2023]
MAFANTPSDIVQKRTLVDLDPRLDFRNMPMRSINFLFNFLNQFEDLESRCLHRYESGTVRLLRQCADYQKDMLVRESPISPDQFEIVTLVAMLLRCLVMSQDIAEVEGNYSPLQFPNDQDVVEMRAEEDSDYFGLSSSITIERIPRATGSRKPRFGNESAENFPVLLTKAVTLTQQTIFRRRPRDVPGLVYCLCLMSLIAQPLRPFAKFMSHIIPAGDAFYDVIYTLCELYTFCSTDVHPLKEEMDLATYTGYVNGDQTAIKYFNLLNELWSEAGKHIKKIETISYQSLII